MIKSGGGEVKGDKTKPTLEDWSNAEVRHLKEEGHAGYHP